MTSASTDIEPQSESQGATGVGDLHLALPKGRMHDGVLDLIRAAGISVGRSERGYRPRLGLDGVECKLLKPRAIVEMLAIGRRDIGIAGADWVEEDIAAGEPGSRPVELLDTGLDPVRLVVAAPVGALDSGSLPARGADGRPLVIASEYVALTRRWIEERGIEAQVLRSYGATEVLPPEDADAIVDNVATGATLAANGLAVCGEVMRSSTRLYASAAAMDDPSKRARIEDFAVLLDSVLQARKRALIEVNVSVDRLDAVVAALPCMRQPTVSTLHGQEGYAVKAAVPREQLASVIGALRTAGGTDVIVTTPQQIVA